VEEPVTDAAWAETRVIFATGQGSVKVFEEGNQVASLSEHAGAATALSLHPSGEILASVGTDKSIVFYDLIAQKRAARAYTDAGKSHHPWHINGLLTLFQLLPLAHSTLMATSSLLVPPLVRLSSS
jgi:pre-mRNA-processing factor 19